MNSSLIKNAIFNTIYKLMNVLFPLVSSAYLSRILLPEGIGRVSYAQSFASIFVILASLGIPTYGIKTIASLKNNDDQKSLSKNYSGLLIIIMTSTLFFSLIYLSLVFVVDNLRDNFLLYLATGLQVLMVALNVDWLYQGMECYKFITVRSFFVKLFSLICIVVFVRERSDYIIYALLTSIAVAGNNIFNIVYSKKYVSFSLKEAVIKKHIKPAFILLFSTLAIELYSKIDVLMLGVYSNESNIGYYTNSIKVINSALVAITAVTAVFLPRLSKLYTENREEFNKLVNLGLRVILFFVLPCIAGLVTISDDFVITMFGDAFIDASVVIRILSPLILIKGVGDLINYQVIISAGKEKYFLITNTTAALINIVLNYILIPKYEQNGAAIASLISELVVNTGMLLVTSKIVHLKIKWAYIFKLIISTVLMVIVVKTFSIIYSDLSVIYRLIIEVAVGIAVYFAVNIILKNEILMSLKSSIRNKL